MLRELQKKMEEFHMVSSGDKVLAGVSGGADSVCLLLALLALQKEMNFSLEVIHVEHGIRGEESVKDAEFVEDLCRRCQVLCHSVAVDVPAYCKQTGLGVEEAARILRYQVFTKLALERGAKIALAHHQEDNAETILFQMVRGSSLAGLCGMQPVREDETGVCYIRPLLFFHRREIEGFLQSHGMGYRVDCTNAELDYSRNFLRAQVFPKLSQINVQAVEHMNQTAAHLSEIKEYLDLETERLWGQIATVDERIALDGKALLQLHPVMQRQIAYKAIVLTAKQKKDIASIHVEDLLVLCGGQSGRKMNLPYGICAWKEFDIVYLACGQTHVETETSEDKVYEVPEEMLAALFKKCDGDSRALELVIGDGSEKIACRIIEKNEESLEIPRKTYTKWFDYDKIKQGFCIRTRRSGDYFISDALGHRKKLKTYFIDEKIPIAERDKRWLLAKDNEVLWLIGGRISEHIKVSQKTKYILEITYDGGNENE
ncbi:MAG: tRNA lysidine(34) synthetase TilS [Agathobacter sp.]|nr:tRNA lysidine(34) synthetase TilS [Agathobacter sp.]